MDVTNFEAMYGLINLPKSEVRKSSDKSQLKYGTNHTY